LKKSIKRFVNNINNIIKDKSGLKVLKILSVFIFKRYVRRMSVIDPAKGKLLPKISCIAGAIIRHAPDRLLIAPKYFGSIEV